MCDINAKPVPSINLEARTSAILIKKIKQTLKQELRGMKHYPITDQRSQVEELFNKLVSA